MVFEIKQIMRRETAISKKGEDFEDYMKKHKDGSKLIKCYRIFKTTLNLYQKL